MTQSAGSRFQRCPLGTAQGVARIETFSLFSTTSGDPTFAEASAAMVESRLRVRQAAMYCIDVVQTT
ncbi:hypothetical protein F0A16_16315 [Salinicola corii]|uniref:Uncharacterized protein n=1 Tax=Salinicola corii TaxID=2606937 RepID=A0A640WCD6_9GAMM|nr:hypothetical protein [Salinicola corii]KAA0016639.1 hypothetical protein F0A16_16315 [Salinicola corii]